MKHPVVAGFVLSGSLFACLSTPTPLAPQVGGSVGLPHSGSQTEAQELPARGPGFVRFRTQGKANWGQPHFVQTLMQSSEQLLAQWGAAPPVSLGDLSQRFGGRIPRHQSHRSGRDVDLLWRLTTLDGRPIPTRGFVPVGGDGIAIASDGGVYRLDVPREWQLLRSLLTSREIQVQWMFCSQPVEALLIEYARAILEPDELVWRAETVLHQPADSLPHDDHIHLRIACRPEDSLRGCSGGGPRWEWHPAPPHLGELSTNDLEEIGRQDPLGLEALPEESAGGVVARTDS